VYICTKIPAGGPKPPPTHAGTLVEQHLDVTETQRLEDESGKETFTQSQTVEKDAVSVREVASDENAALNERGDAAEPPDQSIVHVMDHGKVIHGDSTDGNNTIIRQDNLLLEASGPAAGHIESACINELVPPRAHPGETDNTKSKSAAADADLAHENHFEQEHGQNVWCAANIPGAIAEDHEGDNSEPGTVHISNVGQSVPDLDKPATMPDDGTIAPSSHNASESNSDCNHKEGGAMHGEYIREMGGRAEASGLSDIHSTEGPIQTSKDEGTHSVEDVAHSNERHAETPTSQQDAHMMHRETLVLHECASSPDFRSSKVVKFSSDLPNTHENTQQSTKAGLHQVVDEATLPAHKAIFLVGNNQGLAHIWASSGELNINRGMGMVDGTKGDSASATRGADPNTTAEYTYKEGKEGGTNPEANTVGQTADDDNKSTSKMNASQENSQKTAQNMWWKLRKRTSREAQSMWWTVARRSKYTSMDGTDIGTRTLSSRDTLDLQIIHTGRYVCVCLCNVCARACLTAMHWTMSHCVCTLRIAK
jgi:hypothetical protein